MTESDGGTVAQRIADELADAIRAGEYAPGSRVPSRARLRATYGVADTTANRALHLLGALGLTYPVTGSGWFVRPRRGIVRSTRNRLSRAEREAGRGTFSTDCHAAGLTPDVNPQVDVRPAPEDVAGALGIAPGDDVVIRDRVMRGAAPGIDPKEGEVLQLATSYLPAWLADAAPAIAEEDTGPGGVYARIEDAGHRLTEYTEVVGIGRASEHEARQMDLTPGDPVYRITRTAWAGETAVEVNRITITGDRYELAYELPAE